MKKSINKQIHDKNASKKTDDTLNKTIGELSYEMKHDEQDKLFLEEKRQVLSNIENIKYAKKEGALRMIHTLKTRMLEDEDVSLALMKKGYEEYAHLENKYNAESAGKEIFDALPYSLRSNKSFIMKAIYISSYLYKDVPDNIKNQKYFILELFKAAHSVLSFKMPENFKDDEEFMLELSKYALSVLNYCSGRLKNKKDFIIKVNNNSGFNLFYLRKTHFSSDIDVVIAAMKENVKNSEYADQECLKQEEFTLAILKEVPEYFDYMPENFKKDDIFLKKMVNNPDYFPLQEKLQQQFTINTAISTPISNEKKTITEDVDEQIKRALTEMIANYTLNISYDQKREYTANILKYHNYLSEENIENLISLSGLKNPEYVKDFTSVVIQSLIESSSFNLNLREKYEEKIINASLDLFFDVRDGIAPDAARRNEVTHFPETIYSPGIASSAKQSIYAKRGIQKIKEAMKNDLSRPHVEQYVSYAYRQALNRLAPFLEKKDMQNLSTREKDKDISGMKYLLQNKHCPQDIKDEYIPKYIKEMCNDIDSINYEKGKFLGAFADHLTIDNIKQIIAYSSKSLEKTVNVLGKMFSSKGLSQEVRRATEKDVMKLAITLMKENPENSGVVKDLLKSNLLLEETIKNHQDELVDFYVNHLKTKDTYIDDFACLLANKYLDATFRNKHLDQFKRQLVAIYKDKKNFHVGRTLSAFNFLMTYLSQQEIDMLMPIKNDHIDFDVYGEKSQRLSNLGSIDKNTINNSDIYVKELLSFLIKKLDSEEFDDRYAIHTLLKILYKENILSEIIKEEYRHKMEEQIVNSKRSFAAGEIIDAIFWSHASKEVEPIELPDQFIETLIDLCIQHHYTGHYIKSYILLTDNVSLRDKFFNGLDPLTRDNTKQDKEED